LRGSVLAFQNPRLHRRGRSPKILSAYWLRYSPSSLHPCGRTWLG
jgi:hypothetical protein